MLLLQIVSDEHMDPAALQIEKEEVKTVRFCIEDNVIPFSDNSGTSGSGMSGSGSTEESTEDRRPGGEEEAEEGGSSIEAGEEREQEEEVEEGGRSKVSGAAAAPLQGSWAGEAPQVVVAGGSLSSGEFSDEYIVRGKELE